MTDQYIGSDPWITEQTKQWNKRYGATIATQPVEDINLKINKKAADTTAPAKKAVRGSGEGFWSRVQKDKRLDQHTSNWTERNVFQAFNTTAPEAIIEEITIQNPYRLSRIHQRRQEVGENSPTQQIMNSGVIFEANVQAPQPQQ